MTAPRYVMHDGARWRVREEFEDDGEQWYDLVKRRRPGQPGLTGIVARVSECGPDTHEPKRVLRAEGVTLTFNVARNIVKIRKGRGKAIELTLPGLYQAAAWQAARVTQRDRAFKRRTRRL